MKPVRIGIVGIGNMGSAHAVQIFSNRVDGLVLTAVCDRDASRRRWAAQTLPGVPVYDDLEVMLAASVLDALLVATPHYDHPPMAVAGFRHGLHVLIEKPAGVTGSAVEEMNRAAARSGRVFGVMFNQRTDPLFSRARELVRSGQLGEPKRLVWLNTNWYRPQAYYRSGGWRATWAGEGGGVLRNQAPHNLDLWQWVFGMPQRLRAFCGYGRYHDIEVEDDVTIYGEYDNGATAVFVTSTGEYPGTNRLEISGDRGKLVIEEGRLRFWELACPERSYCFETTDLWHGPELTASAWSPDASGAGHLGILQNFTDAIRRGEPLLAPGYEGLYSLQIANAALLSDWTGETVSLPPDNRRFEELLRERIAASPRSSASDTPTPSAAPGGEYSPRWQVRW